MGFDIECILNIQSLAGEYFCPVCRTLVYPNEALQSQCTHLYCKPCLTYVVGTTRACPYDGYLVTEADSKPLIESNKTLAETIGKVAVHCLFHRSGCTWQGPLSECTSHCSGCAFGNSPVVCNRCGIQIVHRQVQEHAQSCPGANPQAQQASESVQDAPSSGIAAAADQSQTSTQLGGPTPQAHNSQTAAAPPSGQDPNKQATGNPVPQAVALVPGLTPEQWYQQQHQQYYQHYPGYDPYQQAYQQYYPYQQQATQHPQQVQGQHLPQAYNQPLLQPQLQPHSQPPHQPQVQPLLQPQAQPQPQPQPQSQPQIPPPGQPQPHPYVQAPVDAQNQNQAQVNPQQQLHTAVQPHAQIQSQTHPSHHGHLPHLPQPQPRPQSYPQAQPPPQPLPVQPHPQQHMQVPQYQQSHSLMHHPQPQAHLHPQPQSQPHLQVQLQAQVQNHSQPHTQLHPPQTNQPSIPNAQPQSQHSLAQSVSGHHSYPQPQAPQQIFLRPPQQHPVHMHSSSGSLPPAQLHGQFPQPDPQMRPAQSHTIMLNQQPALSQGQIPSILLEKQQQMHPNPQQPGHPVHQHPVMQPTQQPVPPQYVQQQQSFPGQPSGAVQSQLQQHGHFGQQQHMQSQLRPQGPTQSRQQNSLAYFQPQQSAALAHGIHPHQSQNYAGRHIMPNHGVQPFPQSPDAFGVAAQARPMELGSNNKTNNQFQAPSEQKIVQSGSSIKFTVGERKGAQLSERSVEDRKAGSPSQKTADKDANDLAVHSVEMKALKSETGTKFMDDECKPTGEGVARQDETLVKDADSEVHVLKAGSGVPAIKETVKEDGSETTLEPSPSVKSVDSTSVEEKGVTDVTLKQVELSSEFLDGQKGKLPKDTVNSSAQASNGADKGSQTVFLASASHRVRSVHNVIVPGNSQNARIGKDNLQCGYQETNLSQARVTPQGPGVDEFSDYQGKGRHTLPPMLYGPSAQQRPAVPSMSQSMPPPGPSFIMQVPGQPPTLFRPQGLGHLPQSGQLSNPPEHFQPPVPKQPDSFHSDILLGGVPGLGSTASFGREPGHFGHLQRSFELQSGVPVGLYNPGHLPPSLGEPTGQPLGAIPPGSFDPQGGIMGRAAAHGPEGPIGPQLPTNPVETEMFSNQRPHHFNGRQANYHVPGSLEGGPFGQPSGVESNAMRMNGAPVLNPSSGLGLRDGRFKTLTEEHLNPFPVGPSRHLDQGEYVEGLKHFPRHSPLGSEASPRFGSNFSSSKPVHSSGGDPKRFLPAYHPGVALHPNDAGERALPVGRHEDSGGRTDSSLTHPDFLGPEPGFGRHHMERLPVRSPGREYIGVPSRGFGVLPGFPGGQSGLDDIDGREKLSFGDPVGNSFHESRFPILPGRLRKGEVDGTGNLRVGDHLRSGDLIGQDILPSHLRRGEFLGPRNLPSHLSLREPAGFGMFPGHARRGELAVDGGFPHRLPLGESFGANKSSHPRLGEPGFRSSYSLQRFPNVGGFYAGDSDSFDKIRKRKPASTGWCRICKLDCETVEGLDLHSQTREHQKMAMDMVISIKRQITKKHKTSNDYSALEEARKSRKAGFEGRGNNP